MGTKTEQIAPTGELLRLDPTTGALRARDYTVSVVAGPDARRTLPLEDRMTVGTHAANGLVLTDTAVSRYHLELTPRGDGVAVRDLESRNGVFLGGARVQDAIVESDSTISLGRTKLDITLREHDTPLEPKELTSFGNLVGRSVATQALFRILERIAPTQVNVLVLGETGTGKELIARALHDASTRRERPFVVFDCGAVAENLIESEFFGHVKGAFTGAMGARAGAFEQANSGTIFLDEIGDLPLAMQPKLLRALEAGMVKRVGETGYRRVDVRVVAATHHDLGALVQAGRFRADLYYRLSVIVVRVPALRDRREDIPLLVRLFAERLGRAAAEFDEHELRRLYELPFAGNVRELRNEVERALLLPSAGGPPPSSTSSIAPRSATSALSDEAFEARGRRVVDALFRRAGNQKLAAQDLGISRRTLLNWLDEHQVPRPRKGSS